MKYSCVIVSLAFLLSFSSASADVPEILNFQGVLTDASGTVLPDGQYNVTFRLYTQQTAGTPIWQEAHLVTVNKGIFNAPLGYTQVLSALNFDETYYLGISVEGGEELSPRIMLSSAAYAMNSRMVMGSSQNANKLPDDGNVGIGTTTPTSNLHIRKDTGSLDPMIVLDNQYGPGAQSLIDFKFNNTLEARIRKASGGNLFFETVLHGITLRAAGYNRLAILSNGRVGVGTDSPLEQLDVAGGLRIGNTSNANSGTIRWTGTDFEGYDGSNWKSFTSGAGGGLPPGIYGNTLYHNGSNWTATNSLYNNGTYIGIGTTNPGARLNVDGNQWDLNNTEGDFKIGDANYRLKFGVATGGAGAGTANIRVAGGVQKLSLGGGTAEVLSLDGAGNTSLGSSSSNAKFRLYRSGIDSSLLYLGTNPYGGNICWYDEAHNITVYADADASGTGGFFSVFRSPGNYAFYVDGNTAGTQEPSVGIVGSARSVSIDLRQSGNASVVLPSSAVSASEIFDEPGVASYAEGSTSVELYAALTTIGSRSITVPAAGYVLVIGTANASISHTSGIYSSMYLGVSADNTSLPDNQNLIFRLDSSLPTGVYVIPATVHGLFFVSGPGTYTYYLLGQSHLAGKCNCYNIQLTILYIPTAYGTVTPTVYANRTFASDENALVRSGLTAAEISAERSESQAANSARIERELASMREEMEALKRRLETIQK